MIKVSGEKLFDYLDNLKNKLICMEHPLNKDYLTSLMHSQMIEIITVESTLLKYLHPNKRTKAQISISPNGFPLAKSLNSDLEKMCDMSKEKKVFCEIAKRFKRGKNYNEIDAGRDIYVSIHEHQWMEELRLRGGQKLSSNIGFSINETDDKKFELSLREEIYIQDYDEYSKKLPVMIRKGKIRYHTIWGKLKEHSEESFYIPNEEFKLGEEIINPSKKSFSGISTFYKFGRFDYRNVKKPLLLKWKGNSIDYSKFLAAGTDARVKITEDILEVINNTLKKEVIIKGIKKENLAKVLAFSKIPFQNAPTATPNKDELTRFEGYNKTLFDLIYNLGGEKIGKIGYLLPHNYKVYSDANDLQFILGGISLNVYGSAILNENQDYDLKEGLKRVKKCELE